MARTWGAGHKNSFKGYVGDVLLSSGLARKHDSGVALSIDGMVFVYLRLHKALHLVKHPNEERWSFASSASNSPDLMTRGAGLLDPDFYALWGPRLQSKLLRLDPSPNPTVPIFVVPSSKMPL